MIVLVDEDAYVIVFNGIDGPTAVELHKRGITGEHIPVGRAAWVGLRDAQALDVGGRYIKGPCFKAQKNPLGPPTWMAVRDYAQTQPADLSLIEFVDLWMSEIRR